MFSCFLLAGTFLSAPNAQAFDITEWTDTIENWYDERIDNIKINVENAYSIIDNRGEIGNIESSFVKNEVVIDNSGFIENVSSVFEQNMEVVRNYGYIGSVKNSMFQDNKSSYEGGAIASQNGGYIREIADSSFINNTVFEWGPEFVNLQDTRDVGRGGAIYLQNANVPQVGRVDQGNKAVTSILNSTFKGNHAAAGGAIFSSQMLNIDNTLFEGNYNNTFDGAGGAIVFWGENVRIEARDAYPEPEAPQYIGEQKISNSRFINNYSGGRGGAIYAGMNENDNVTYDINVKNTLFEGNKAQTGGAIYADMFVNGDVRWEVEDKIRDMPRVERITVKFGDKERVFVFLRDNRPQRDFNIYNMTAAEFDEYVKSGGQYYIRETTLEAPSEELYNQIIGEVEAGVQPGYQIDNFDQYKDALYTAQNVPVITPALNITNSSFINNKAENGQGGAIYGHQVKITADSGESIFKGNTANGKSNAVYIAGQDKIVIEQNAMEDGDGVKVDWETSVPVEGGSAGSLTLESVNNGKIVFDDGINGENYNIDVFGDGTGYVKFNNTVENVSRFTMNSGSIVHLGLNGKLYVDEFVAQNDAASVGLNAVNNPLMTIDVMVDKANNTVLSGAVYVGGDVRGTTNVLVNSLNPDVLDNPQDAIVPFLFAPNDDNSTSAVFNVARVIGSPYMWYADKNVVEEPTQGNTWYLSLTDNPNPDFNPSNPEVTP